MHEYITDEYVDRLAARAEELTVGDPSNPDVEVDPIINESQRDQMMSFLDESVVQGATIETGGDNDGLYVEPTVLTDISNEMPISCNEHFGPIAPVITFSDIEKTIAIANDTEYGLSSSVHTSDIQRGKAIARRLEAGMVHLNDHPINDEPHIPFRGRRIPDSADITRMRSSRSSLNRSGFLSRTSHANSRSKRAYSRTAVPRLDPFSPSHVLLFVCFRC